VSLHDFDLNLLRVLLAVYEAGSVSRAAESLGVSQPTVSSALGRLRRSLGEPLFIKTAAGVTPTARTHALAASARAMLLRLEADFFVADRFDPARYAGNLTVALSDVGELVFLPRILDSVRRQAPHSTLNSVALAPGEMMRAMEDGEVDLAIGYYPDLDAAGFYREKLLSHRFVCLLRADHPVQDKQLSLERFLALDHAAVRAKGRSQEIFEKYLERLRIERRIVLRTPHFMSLPGIIGRSDLVVTLPHAIGHYFTRVGENVRMAEPPLAIPRIELYQHWHRGFHHDPRNRWLRTLVASLFSAESDEWPYPFA
jgi:DNA-binding transcriptional LysR family regulator